MGESLGPWGVAVVSSFAGFILFFADLQDISSSSSPQSETDFRLGDIIGCWTTMATH